MPLYAFPYIKVILQHLHNKLNNIILKTNDYMV